MSLVKQELFILLVHLPVCVGYVLHNLLLFVLCFTNHCLSFVLFLLAITPTFQLNSFQQVRDKPLSFFLSKYLVYMKQNQIILLSWNIGSFSSFSQNFCCILKVRWLFPNQMFITQNAFIRSHIYINPGRGRGGRDHMVAGFTTTWSMKQSVHITTNLVRSIPAHGDVYSIQHLVIKFVKDMRQVGSFSGYSSFLHQ
jgi:hypothetical protein